uniref:Uncharacterized protein n=1 Tax=Plectus sambesii TaxID=2011161 RepID=A0A914XAM4_9BILA
MRLSELGTSMIRNIPPANRQQLLSWRTMDVLRTPYTASYQTQTEDDGADGTSRGSDFSARSLFSAASPDVFVPSICPPPREGAAVGRHATAEPSCLGVCIGEDVISRFLTRKQLNEPGLLLVVELGRAADVAESDLIDFLPPLVDCVSAVENETTSSYFISE